MIITYKLCSLQLSVNFFLFLQCFYVLPEQVELYSAMWKLEGRVFELVATFDNIAGIECVANCQSA